MVPSPPDPGAAREAITRELEAARRGEPRAGDRLLPLVYDELRRLAAAAGRMRPPARRSSPPPWCTRRISG